MTPNQAYAQWKQWGADPSDSEAQSIQKFSQQFGLAPNEEDELLKANPEFEYRAPKESGFLAQTFGAGMDELQKSAGSAIAGPGAEVLADFGWEGGAGFLEDIGSDIVRQQDEDLQAYEAPQTRDELIKEGGVWGSLYEHVLPEETQTPQQLGRSALPSLGAAGIALGAAGVAALASGGNPFIVGATAMAVGNAVGSFQVGGEEFEAAKRDPFIRKQLGINPDANFEDLTPDQQRTLTDSAQRVAKDTMVERLYTSGALESLAFIPYGPLALRYIADIALGATSEELDKRLGMENTLEELQRLGVTREEVPELREKIKGMRPGTFETIWNAAIMEATFGAPTAVIETIAQPDSRVNQYLTAKKGKADKLKILDKNIEEAMADPIKLKKAENDLIKQDDDREIRRQKEADRIFDRQKKKEDEALVDLETRQQKADEMSGQDREGRTIESSEVNGFSDFIRYKAGMTPEQVDTAAMEYAEEASARAEAWAKQETDKQFEPAGKKKKKKKKKSTSSRSKSAREEVVIEGEGVLDSMDAMDSVPAGTAIDSVESDPSGSLISFDKITHQVALNEYMAAFPEINFKGSTLVKDQDGVTQVIYEDENGDIQSDTDWELMEGFVDDEQIFGKKESPVVYLTQSMYDDQGHLITDAKAAIERMTEVAFHEAIGHAGLRNLLSAGKMLDVDPDHKDYQRWEGEQYNRFIDGFRNRHSKMINRWVKGDGNTYANESEFRQTEEFIARNYGEAGGGKPIGFFDNAAILLREINPFIGNSLTQHQVAKQLQLVVDRYATGIKGKAPSKKNILSGAELVGTIARAATEAGLEEELKSETDIELTSPRREKAKAERKGLEALKAPETTYEVMAPEQIQELQKDRTILEKAREKQTAGIKEEKELLKKMAPVLRKKIKTDTAKKVKEEARAIEAQNIKDLTTANNKKTTPESLAELAQSDSKTVRKAVAKNKNTSGKTLAMLADPKSKSGIQTVEAALSQIDARKNEITTWREKESTRKKNLKEAQKIVDDISKIESKDRKKSEKNKLKNNKKLVTALSKEIPAPKHYTPPKKRSKSKRSKSERRQVKLPLRTLEGGPLEAEIRKLLLGPSEMETEEHRGKKMIPPSRGERFLRIKKDKKGDPILDENGKIQGEWVSKKRQGAAHISEAAATAYLPGSRQTGMTLELSKKPGETEKQFKAKFQRTINKIYKKAVADKTDPGAPLTEETKGVSRMDEKALGYEAWAMGVTLVGKEDLQFEANERTRALFYDNRIRRSAEDFTEIVVLEEGIKKELQTIANKEELLQEHADNEELLADTTKEGKLTAKGREVAKRALMKPAGIRAAKRQIEASKLRIRTKEDKIQGARKIIGKNLQQAFNKIKSGIDQESILMYYGIHEDHGGKLTLGEIAEIMSKPEYIKGFREKYPNETPKERVSYKNVHDAIKRALVKMSGNPDVESENYLPLAQFYHEEKGVEYNPRTGLFEGGKLATAAIGRKKRKGEKEIKAALKELTTGSLAGRYVKGSKEKKAQRLAAIQELYKTHKVVVKPYAHTKESTRKWGVSPQDMKWAKENDYPPYAREGELVEKKVVKDKEQIEFRSEEGKEAEKTISALAKNNLDYYIQNPDEISDLSPGMLDLIAERASKEGIKFGVGGKTKSKRSIRGFKGKSAKIDRNIKEKILASDVMKSLRYFMTPTELESLTKETIDAIVTLATKGKTRTGKNITITKLRDKKTKGIIETPRLTKEALAAMAYAGRFKKGWYRHGARQLKKVFLTDTNRFIALLAATSPQTSVEMNLENSLRIWNNWEKAGRPTEAKEIKRIMGRSVVGKGTEESVMDAWVNNSITALSASDPTKIELSGPKADSFMQNLLENLDEVTLDTWQGRAYNLLQDVFGGIQRKATEGRGVKSPGYILSAAKTREAAAFLSKKTGTKWEPAEIQETIWSFVKALYEKRKSPAGRTTPMDSLFLTLSQNEIANVPDFASLISTNKYGSLLNKGKYGKRISSVKQFQTSAEAIATPSYRGLETTLNRIAGELESQFRTTDTSRVTKGIRDKIHRGVVADRDGTGGGKRTFIGRSTRNPGGKLTGLGKLTKYNLTELDRKRLNALGVSTPEFFGLPKSPETGRIFQEAIEASKKEHPQGAAVYVYSPEEYSTFKNFLTKDGKTGFSVKPNGDIVSVFNTPSADRPSSSLTSLMLAVENGGTKLDAFDTILPQLYSRAGFRISSRMAWNDEFAPANWDKKAFSKYNKGEPDVVFMHYDPDSTEVYNAPIGKRKKKEETGRESILFDDYDAAVNLQTRNVEESQGRFKKAKRIPGKQAERMGHNIPKAPWKVEERSLVPAVAKTITDPNFRVMPVSKSKRSKSEISRSTFSAGADQRFGSKWTNFWLRQINKLKPLSKLDPDSKKFYLQLRQVAFGQLAQWEFFSNSVFKALKDSKQSKEIYKYLTTPNANSSIISDPNERVHAEKAKRAIEKIGETLVSKKLMKETTLRDFKKKHGDYLPRVYLRHLLNESDRTAIARGLKPSNLDYLKQRRDIPKGIRELILGQLTDQQGAPALLASRALMVPGKDLAIMNWMQKMKDLSTSKNLGWVIPNQFVKFNTLEEARNIAKDLKLNSAVIKELELDIDFSDMSTEVTPAWLAAESDKLRLMSHDLQGDRKKIVKELYRRMYEEAQRMEPMFGEKVKIDNFRKLPNSARYGAMRGMWIHKQIADDIIGGMKLATGDESNWEKIVGETGMMGKYNAYWKWAKVAGNPPSWARNYISNNILLTLAGIPFWSIPRLNLAAMKEIRTKGKYYQIALKQGVMAGNMSNAELGRMESDFLQIERNMSDSGNPLSFLGTRVHAGVGKVMEKTSNIYGGIETLGKIGAIKYAMEQKGMNESEAAAFANKWLFDYGLVTPSVRYASTAVVGAPFIRFQSHAIPLMLEVGLTKPWRFLPYYALGYGMIEMFKNSHDIDEEEYEAIKLALAPWLQEKALNPKLPGTNIPLLPPNVLPIPYLDKQGRWQIHDVSYLMPWGMMTEVAGETLKGQFSDAMKSLGLMGGPLADAMVVIKTGVDPFTRRPITDDTKPYIDQVGDYIKYIYNMSMPSMFHTSHGAVNRIWDSAMGNLDPKTGELKYEPLQAWLRLGGQNIYPTNLVEQRRTNIRRMKWEMGNLKSAHKRRLRGLLKSKASKEEIAEAREEYREQLKERREEIIDYTKKSKVPRSLRSG